jgi:acyl-CoA synthetase (AMP-forming)/AMP-acid ligase II
VRNVVTTAEQADRYRAAGLWTADTLSSRVGDHVREGRGARVAVVDLLGERSRNYEELAADAARVATLLASKGVKAGDVVSIQLPNCYEAVVVAVAANSVGAVLNPLLTNYRARELCYVLQAARPAAMVTPGFYHDFDHRELVAAAGRNTGVRPLHVVVDATEAAGDLDLVAALAGSLGEAGDLRRGSASAEVSELIFTSGTEATPKAIMHTEETANFAVRATFADLGITPDDVVWMPSPVGHSTGFNYGIRAALYHGNTLVLQDRWNAADAAALVGAYRCNYTLAATTFLEDLVSECERSGAQLPSLTHFGCGGSPVPAQLVQRAADVGIRVLRLYGSTEVLCATWNRPDSPAGRRRTTDGYALQHTEIEVRDDDGNSLELPAVGELHIRGPNTSVGLFDDPERTRATFLAGGWVRSGDLARLDADRYLTVIGRRKEIIIRGGVNIAPREIEDLIVAFPEVRQAAVVGIPDQRLGERGCACLVLQPDATLSFGELVDRLRADGLATYKLPETMLVMDSLPVTPSGKVQKHEILRQIQAPDTPTPQPGR